MRHRVTTNRTGSVFPTDGAEIAPRRMEQSGLNIERRTPDLEN